MINVIKPNAKSVGAGLLANAVGQLPMSTQTNGFRGQARSYRCDAISPMIVPTLRVGMSSLTPCNGKTTRSVASGVTTRSVGTSIGGTQSTGTIIGGTESVAMINIIKPDTKSVGAGLLANAVGQLPLQAQADGFRGQARSYSLRCSS